MQPPLVLRSLALPVATLAIVLSPGCGPDWDGLIDTYAVAPGEGEGEAASPKDLRDLSAQEVRFDPCQVLADERCRDAFGPCGSELIGPDQHDDALRCAEAERATSCDAHTTRPPRAFRTATAQACFDEMTDLTACPERAAVLTRCDDELWRPTTCTQTAAPGTTTLAIRSEGAHFLSWGEFASVCVTLDPATDTPVTPRTAAAADSANKLDTLLFIFDPDGAELANNDDDPDRDGLLSALRLPELSAPGQYTVIVAGYGSTDVGPVVLEFILADR